MLPKAGSFTPLLTVGLLTGKDGPVLQVGRLLGAAATISEAVGGTASSALNATSTVAASATNVVLAFTSNTLSLTDTLWHGLDFLNLQVSRCGGAITADSAEVLKVWLETENAQTLWPCMHPVLNDSVVSMADSLSFTLPAVESAWEELYNLSHYGKLQLQGTVLFTGQLHVVFESVNVSFHALWSNPLWEPLGFSPESERSQILEVLRKTIASLPKSDVQWDVGVAVELPLWLQTKGLVSRFVRICLANLQVLWSLAVSRFLWGVGIVVSMAPLLLRHRQWLLQQVKQAGRPLQLKCNRLYLNTASYLHKLVLKFQTGFEMVSGED